MKKKIWLVFLSFLSSIALALNLKMVLDPYHNLINSFYNVNILVYAIVFLVFITFINILLENLRKIGVL